MIHHLMKWIGKIQASYCGDNSKREKGIKLKMKELLDKQKSEIKRSMRYKNKKMLEIIKTIEENPKILESLNIERLKIIDDYYIYQINELKKKI